MKKIIISLLLVSCFSVKADVKTNDYYLNKADKNTFQIKTDKGVGTGFISSISNLIITNKHVVNKETKEINIINSENKKFKGKLEWYSDKYDIALISTKEDLKFSNGLDFCENSTKYKLNSEIYGFGSPAGLKNIFRKGYIAEVTKYDKKIKQHTIKYQEYTGRGTSGGAILSNKDHCVLALNYAGFLEYDLGIGLPVEILKSFVINYEKEIKNYTDEEKRIFRINEEMMKILKIQKIINKKVDLLKKEYLTLTKQKKENIK